MIEGEELEPETDTELVLFVVPEHKYRTVEE